MSGESKIDSPPIGPSGKPRRTVPFSGKKLVKKILLALLAVVILLALLEGLCSLGIFLHDFAVKGRQPVAERRHTQYDPELGWVNIPNTCIKDLYGPGRTVTINATGFRNLHDFSEALPEGKMRILCSGDSFTFGYGVGDGDTWCAQLEEMAPGVEVGNMALGGYGIDQMYLSYRRDRARMKHQLHLFTFVSLDFVRMCYDSFRGYGKPILKLENNLPVADGVPVPRRAFYVPWLMENLEWIQGLRMVQLFTTNARKGGGEEPEALLPMKRARGLALRAMEVLHEDARDKGIAFVVVWLPMMQEYRPFEWDGLRAWLKKQLAEKGIPFIDLVEPFRTVPINRVDELFLGLGEVNFPGAAAHFSARGNRYIAGQLAEHLRKIPGLDFPSGK